MNRDRNRRRDRDSSLVDRPPRRPPPKEGGETEIIYGHRAALAVLAHRPGDVLRLACSRAHESELQALVQTRFVVLPDHEIERIARSPQHEGLVLEARARKWTSPQELGDRLVKSAGTAIALDRVRNSYNIGAALRGAAFFGIDAALLGAPAPHPGIDANAIRVAEGGIEHLVLSRTTDLADTLARLKTRGVRVIGTDGQADTSALRYTFPRPCVVVMGNEREGLGPRVRAQCDALVAIRGSGAVESLNIAVATGILCAQLAR